MATRNKPARRPSSKSRTQNEKTMQTLKTTTVEVSPWVVLFVVVALLAIGSLVLSDHGVRWHPLPYIETTEALKVTEVPVSANADLPEVAMPIMQSFETYESEGGIPFNGSEWNADVAPDEMEVLTGGPMAISGVSLPGGETRGSVIILLPGTKVVSYKVTNLLPGSNWHASYRPGLVDESTWRALANDRVAAMQQAPNCHPGTGCITLDILVVGPNGIVAQWVVSK